MPPAQHRLETRHVRQDPGRPHRQCSFRRHTALGRCTLTGRAGEAHWRAAAQACLVQAAALACHAAAGRDPQRAAGEEPARHRGAAARQSRQCRPRPISIRPSANGRTTDGTQQRSALSAAWARRAPLRPQRPARAHVPRHRQPADAQPARRQPRADDARPVPAGDDSQSAGRLVDSVHGARLVRAQASRRPTCIDIPLAPGDDLVRRADEGRRASVPDAGAGRVDAPARLRQPEQPLVGRARRSTAATPRRAAKLRTGERRQAAASSRPDCCRSIPTTGVALHRLHRQLVGRPGDAAHALRAASTTPSATCSRTSIRDWTDDQLFGKAQADQLGADGQDPHRRVDAGDRAAPGHRDRDEHQLVRPGRRGSAGRVRRSSTTSELLGGIVGSKRRSSHARRIR